MHEDQHVDDSEMLPIMSVVDPKKPYFRFPLSPPSSGAASALSSPLLTSLAPESAQVAEKLLAANSESPTAYLLTSSISNWPQPTGGPTDSDGNAPEKTSHQVFAKFSPRNSGNRALTLPSSSSSSNLAPVHSPSKLIRRDSRRSCSASSSASSSSAASSPENTSSHPPTSGIGRKVAATLQLFKETTSTDDGKPSETSRRAETSTARRRNGSTSQPTDVTEPQFEFVKRSEWPDREAAAVRRERSSTALERARTRDSIREDDARAKERKLSTRDSSQTDLAQWRKDNILRQETARGRRRERTADEVVGDLADLPTPISAVFQEPPSPFIRPRSRVYPPSPSPSRSPTSRTTPFPYPYQPPERNPRSPHSRPSLSRRLSRSSTPVQTHFSPPPLQEQAPLSPQESTHFSPYSTDDESTWETASATTSTSTTSTHPPSLRQFPSSSIVTDDDLPLLYSRDDHGQRLDKSSQSDIGLDHGLHEHLPHIPLRPFRNQVGGHSAIYKFTKQAVCKPLVSRENLFYESVEREAPPLLDFIPRYLGVMLVSYRRVPKGTHASRKPSPTSPRSSPRASRPSIRHAATHAAPMSSGVPIPRHQARPPLTNNDSDTDEAEMPEVVLDRNRHIVPEWVLRGSRNRSLSSSALNGSTVIARKRLQRSYLHSGTASSPDLGSSPNISSPAQGKPSPLASYPSFVSQIHAPTPVNSPSQIGNVFPPRLGQRASIEHTVAYHSLYDNEEHHLRPQFRAFNSEQPRLPHSPWFGGTGSTVVNKRLKDHVFSTVLRRFKRRTGGRWADSARTEDEMEAADDETVSSPASSPPRLKDRGRRTRKLLLPEDTHREVHSENDAPVRRIATDNSQASGTGNKGVVGVFEMDFDRSEPVELSPSISRRRSRSRSLDSLGTPLRPAFHPSPSVPEESSIPEHTEADPTVTRQNHFILMEDLTGRLKHPCVMDLKMGTRQYGMDATSAKKKSQRKKCDRTTSRSLGVRVCGMQVWNQVTESYTTQDKYRGREIRAEDFDSVLASFLHNGQQLLAYQIPVLLPKVYALAGIVNRLKGYRFYGCSILLIYDGDKESQEVFRTSVLEHPTPRSKRGDSLERRSTNPPKKTDKPELRRSHSEDLLLGPVAERSNGRRKRGEVNVRIVDFAHTTTARDWLPFDEHSNRSIVEVFSSSEGYQAGVDPETGLIYARFPPHYPDEPDRGFLFGLKSLAESLERIWNNERISRIKASRDDPSVIPLPDLSADGKDIFTKIFGDDDDQGMIST